LIGAALSEEQQLWLSQKPVRDPMKWGAFLSSDIGKAATRSVVEAAQQFFKQAGF
ncbi:MAG: hypothetical protein JO253_06055, partial [Alphaproteobacteria bacterium]|nr:hypothetical protein [Alphaproteobacteria bacterium]